MLAEALHMTDNDIEVVRVAGMLHDIGKISLSLIHIYAPWHSIAAKISSDTPAIIRTFSIQFISVLPHMTPYYYTLFLSLIHI